MIPAGARVWIAMGHTDMRRGMQSLAAMVQQSFSRDPFAGDLWVFRGRSGGGACEDNLARRPRDVVIFEAIGTREVHLARREGRRGVADELTAGLSARRSGLAEPAI